MNESQELWDSLTEEQRQRLFITMHTYLTVADVADLIIMECNVLS